MKTIQRRGKITASTYGVIDNLTMTHSGNQLIDVADAGSTVSIAESNDFKKGSTAATQYTYNKNGAMSKDLNKSISAVSYNLLNLPAQVTIGGVAHKYTYSADGRKLRVEQGSTNRDYVGSVIYENGSLKRVLIDGGYVEGGVYYYYLNDHLGNVRMVASGTGTILQKNKYYPFGMPMAETGNDQQERQPYKFGTKEFERKGGLNLYDFEARQMDPALGRFTSMDPMAEKYYSISPYAYCNNNPLRFVDPTGENFWDFLRGVGEGAKNKALSIVQAVAHPVDTYSKMVETAEKRTLGENIAHAADQATMGIVSSNIELVSAVVSDINGGDGSATGEVVGGVAADMAIATGTGKIGSAIGKALSKTVKVYRVFGGNAKPDGYSWTPKNPKNVKNFRDKAGLPSGKESGANNSGRFVIEGKVNKSKILESRSALPLDGNKGGLPELIIKPSDVVIQRVSGVNPPF